MENNRYVELMDFIYDKAGVEGTKLSDITIIGFYKDFSVVHFFKGDNSIENLKERLGTDDESEVIIKAGSFILYVKKDPKIDIPHIHVENEIFHTVISLIEPKYLIETNKKYLLYSSNLATRFNDFMKIKIKNNVDKDLNNWRLAIWAYTNNCIVNYDMPDYRRLSLYDKYDIVQVFDENHEMVDINM